MANPAVGINNLADADATTITVSASVGSSNSSKLINPHVGVKWRANDTSAYILADLGSSLPVDTIMLAGLSGIDPDLQVRLSSVDGTGAAGDIHDSGTISGLPYFDPDYGLFVYLLPAPLSTRYVRIDDAEAGVDYTEAGRLGIFTRESFGVGMQAPWSRTAVRGSVITLGTLGTSFVDLRQGYWRGNAKFDFISEAERDGFIEEIGLAIVNDGHLDMLWIKDPDSSNLSRDCRWGYIDGDFTVSQDLYIVPQVFSVEFPVRQRL
jgi:hypothetical protein